MFFCDQEGTQSRLRGAREVIERQGLFCSLYTDRGRHDWHMPEAGGKVDKANPIPFGRTMGQLGIEMIPACIHQKPEGAQSRRSVLTKTACQRTGGRGYDRYGDRQPVSARDVLTGLQRRVHPATTRTRLSLRRLPGQEHPLGRLGDHDQGQELT